jgi:DNA-binding GntR family transcriptional regulator
METIFAGKFPNGARLQERDLASQLGVSRTPLREALLELDSLGIISVQNYRGAVVNRFTGEDLAEIYCVRSVLEAEATRLACEFLDNSDIETSLAAMTAQLTELLPDAEWSGQTSNMDEEFHSMIWEKSNNSRLRRELERYNSIIRPVRKCLGDRFRFQASAIEEHIRILEALKDRKANEAGALMLGHVRNAGQHAMEIMFPSEKH